MAARKSPKKKLTKHRVTAIKKLRQEIETELANAKLDFQALMEAYGESIRSRDEMEEVIHEAKELAERVIQEQPTSWWKSLFVEETVEDAAEAFMRNLASSGIVYYEDDASCECSSCECEPAVRQTELL